MEKKSSWGGAREGAGRKKKAARTICIRVPEDVAAILDALPGSKTDYIIEAVRRFTQDH